MSSEQNHSHKGIDETLNSLNNIQRAKAPAFFYTRLKARMERELENGGPITRWLTRPALTLSIAAIVLILNATVILQLIKQDNNNSLPVNNETPALASNDYSIGTYPVYDDNNSVEP